MKTLKRIERALILPIGILPLAGLMLGIGASMQQSLLDYFPILGTCFGQRIAIVMESLGQIIFNNLSLLFAIGISAGLTGDKGVAALYAAIGFLIMQVVISLFMPVMLPEQLYTNVLGIETLQTSILGGILIGLSTAYLYKKFHDIKFSNFSSDFIRLHFLLVINIMASIIIGLIIAFVWPPIGSLIVSLGEVVASNGTHPLYILLYGVVERLLTPFGLHHIFYYPLWYTELGGIYTSIDGLVTMGDQQIWFQQLSDYTTYGYEAMIENVQAQGALLSGRFMSGKYPFIIFGLPAAAYGLYQEATSERKKAIGGLLLVATLGCVLTGITEPIELAFLFVNPILYLIHALLSGLSFMLMYLFNVHVGMEFSGGIIDLFIYGIIPGDDFTNWNRIIIVGIFYMPLYYFLFRFAIRCFNLSTLGQNVSKENLMIDIDRFASNTINVDDKANSMIEALGGIGNIETLESCMSRLRVFVYDIDEIDGEKIQALGASGMFISGNSLQAIFGKISEQLKLKIEEKMSGVD